MEVINYNDIDFDKLNKLDIKSRESDIYIDNDKKSIYKIFKEDLDVYELSLKFEKLSLLEKKKNLNNIVIPTAKIVTQSFVGIKEDYIEGFDLSDAKVNLNDEEIMEVLLKVSTDLEQMHKNNIIMSDLNFGNIRLDMQRNHYFLDALSYSIDKIPSNAYPYLLVEYLRRYKKKPSSTKNNDKISFIMFTIQLLIDKYFYDIEACDFDKKAEQIKDLELLREVYEDLRNYYVKDVPYLHELIRG